MHNFENKLVFYKNLNWHEIEERLALNDNYKIIDRFFLRDNISQKKFMNNFTVAKLSMGELLIKVNSRTTPFKMDITKSLNFFIYEKFVDRPLGYPTWFISCYPEIVHWCNSNPEILQTTFPFKILDYSCLDSQKYLKPFYLRQIIKFYVTKINSNLECQMDEVECDKFNRDVAAKKRIVEAKERLEEIELDKINESERVSNEALILENEREEKKEKIILFIVSVVLAVPMLMLIYGIFKAIFFS